MDVLLNAPDRSCAKGLVTMLSAPVQKWLFRNFGAGAPTKYDLNWVKTFIGACVLGCLSNGTHSRPFTSSAP
jgi:hypothetical protein